MATVAEFILLMKADTTKLVTGLKGASTSVNALSGYVKDNREALQTVGTTATAVGASLVAALGLGIRAQARFQKQMAFVATMVEDTDRWMGIFAEDIARMSIEFGEGTETLTRGLYDILSASIPAEEALGVLNVAVEAAKGGFTTTAVAADALTTIINAFGMSASDASKIADTMFAVVKRGKLTYDELASSIGIVATTASTSGITFEELGAAIALVTRSGINTQMAVTALNGAMLAMKNPTDQAKKAAEALGVTFDATAVRTKGMLGVLKDVLAATPTEEQLGDLFPDRRARRAIDVMRRDLGAFEKDITAVYDSAGEAGIAFAKATDTLAFQVDRLKKVGGELLKGLGEPLMGFFKVVIRQLASFGKLFTNLPDPIKAVFSVLTLVSGALLTLTGLLVLAMVQFPKFVAAWRVLIVPLRMVVSGILAFKAAMVSALASVGAFSLATAGIGTAVVAAGAALVATIVTFVNWRKAVNEARDAQERFDDQVKKSVGDWEKAQERILYLRGLENRSLEENEDLRKNLQIALKKRLSDAVALETEAGKKVSATRTFWMRRTTREQELQEAERMNAQAKALRESADNIKQQLSEVDSELDKHAKNKIEREEKVTELTKEELAKRAKDEADLAKKREDSIRKWLKLYEDTLRAGIEAFKTAQDKELDGIKERKKKAIEADFDVQRTVIENASITDAERQAQLEALVKAEEKAKDAIIFTDEEMASSRSKGAKAMLQTTLDRIISEISASAIGAIAERVFASTMTFGVSLLAIPGIIAAELAAKAGIQALFGSLERGGDIPITGMYRLHAGERVVPADQRAEISVPIRIDKVYLASDMDVEAVASRIGNVVARRIRQRRGGF